MKRKIIIDNDLLLFDRIEILRTMNHEYDLENNAYLSFSGGKDSTILHYLLDIALPNNNIPRVFIDTGIEYNMIRQFVLKMAESDNRVVIIKPNKPLKKILDEFGYPFKSKEHSLRVEQFNKGSTANYIYKYVNGVDLKGKATSFSCPNILKYQFSKRGQYNYSNRCCYKLKKEPVHQWESNNGKHIVITGMRNSEGGNRSRLGCVITDKNGNLKKFHPLIVVSDEWEKWFVDKLEKEYKTRILCELYYEPYSFKRTGCKGCPFSLELQEQLDTMSMYLPNEKKQCEFIWKPVYDEYRRLGYRLKNSISLFDL